MLLVESYSSTPEVVVSPSVSAASPEAVDEEFVPFSEPSIISAASTPEIETRYRTLSIEIESIIVVHC